MNTNRRELFFGKDSSAAVTKLLHKSSVPMGELGQWTSDIEWEPL